MATSTDGQVRFGSPLRQPPIRKTRTCRSWFQWEDYELQKHRVRCTRPVGHDEAHVAYSEGEEIAW